MIDVIFLLLVFFIYSMIVMVQANVLPVKLATVQAGKRAKQASYDAITIDRAGHFYWDRKRVTSKALDEKLRGFAKHGQGSQLLVAMERDKGGDEKRQVDRGPLLLKLVGRLQAAGIKNFKFVGPGDGG